MSNVCTGYESIAGMSRRRFLNQFGMGLGGMALGGLLADSPSAMASDGILKALHHAPRAKRVIFLFQSGGPSQMDLFDYKPGLTDQRGEELPDSIRAEVPEIKFSVLVFAADPADRFVLINGQRLGEGDSAQPGLKVKEIRREGVVFSYRVYQFLVER